VNVSTPAIIVPKTVGAQWGIDGDQVCMVITIGDKRQVFPMEPAAAKEFCGAGLMAAHQVEKLRKRMQGG